MSELVKASRARKVFRSSAFLLLALIVAGLSACSNKAVQAKQNPNLQSYATEPDWNDPSKLIPLNYQQAQGQRVFYQYCVWCHADSTPAGPSNRSNVTPTPDLMNDGSKLNGMSDAFMRNIITLGGSAMGKSPMMPAYGKTLTQREIDAVMAFTRAIADPPYKNTGRPGSQYSEK